MSKQKPEKKVVSRNVAITLGIICIILAISLVGAVVEYTSLQSSSTTNGLKTIRFYHSAEITGNEINFTWKPTDPTNNAIIYVATYFQYSTPNQTTPLSFELVMNGEAVFSDAVQSSTPNQYFWSRVYGLATDIQSFLKNIPNQSNYTIQFRFGIYTFYTSTPLPVHVKNLNIILLVVDGPQSS
jgi:hypothetical protein